MYQNVKIADILTTRQVRFKPNDPSIADLSRVEKIDFSGSLYLSSKPSKTDMILVKCGDLVISGINVSKGAFTRYEGCEDVTATIHYSSYHFDETRIDPEYFLLFMRSNLFLTALKEQVPGGIKTEIKAKLFLNLEIGIPVDLQVQKRIVTNSKRLSCDISHISDELSKQSYLVDQLRQAFLREAMQGKLVPQDPNDVPASELLKRIKAEKAKLVKEKKIKPGKELPPIKPEEMPYPIPKSWVWCRLGDIILSMTNGIYKEDKYYNNNGIGCFRMYNIKNGRLNYNNLKRMELTESEIATYNLQENDLLLNRVNSVELLGKCAIIPCLLEPYVFESKNIRLRLFHKELMAPFVNQLFLTSLIKDQILHTFKKVTGQASISQDRIYPLLIPLPPEQEQKRIIEKLNKLTHFCEEIQDCLDESKHFSERLLQATLREVLIQPLDGK